MSEEDIRAERLHKLDLLRQAGMEAYPAETSRDHTNAEFLKNYDSVEDTKRPVTLAGRVMAMRNQGGIMFVDIFDGTERVQVVRQITASERDGDLFGKVVDIGDFVEFSGSAFKTKRGQPSLQVFAWKMLAKSLRALPSEHFGLKDEETRLRQRSVDLLLNRDLHELFVRKSRFWQAAREFLLAHGFLEVETPVLENSPGGADARPFTTHHNALDIDVYLRISAGELWQKRLLVAGYPKVFEIGRIFRNEGQSREHLQDYTQLETYESYSDMRKGGEFVKDLYRHLAKETYGRYTFEIGGHVVDLAAEWEIIDFSKRIEQEFDIDPITCSEEAAIQAVRDAKIEVGETLNKARAIDHLWKSVRKKISGPAFLVGVPVFLEPLAKRYDKNPNVVERLQVLIAGSEVGKGYSELNDPSDQRARFEEQQKMREAGDDEAQRLDEEYLADMEFGMPPAFGFGVSERLFAFLEGKPIHECQLFPLLRPAGNILSKKEAEKKYRSKRLVVIADPHAGYGVTANAIGQLGISIGGFSNEKLFDAKTLKDADGNRHYVDGLYPMVNLAGDQQTMAAFVQKCYVANIQLFDFSDIMRKAHSDEEMLKGYAEKKTNDIGYLAVGALVPADFEKEFLDGLKRFE